jgi:flagellar basal-body rod protein FlgB
MTVAAAKQVVSASNIANANTPGYKAKELSFTSALDQQLNLPLTATNVAHVGGQESGSALNETREAEGQARLDGNTVQLDRELLTMAKASGEFARAQTALAAKFRLVRYALTESR